MLQQRLMWILWPAFLVGGVLEMLVFAMFDPQDMHWFGQPIEASRQCPSSDVPHSKSHPTDRLTTHNFNPCAP